MVHSTCYSFNHNDVHGVGFNVGMRTHKIMQFPQVFNQTTRTMHITVPCIDNVSRQFTHLKYT